MKWKWLKWGSLFSICFVGLQLGVMFNVQADGDQSKMDNVMNDYKKAPDGKGLLSGSDIGVQSYPEIGDIQANNTGRITSTTTDRRITSATTKINLHVKKPTFGRIASGLEIQDAQIVLMTNNKKLSVLKSIPVKPTGNAILFVRTKGFTFEKIDLSKLNQLLPLYIGFQITAQNKADGSKLVSTYYMGTLTNGGNQITDADKNKLTIDDGLTPTSTSISGMGTPGYTINSDVNDEVAKVDSKGKYTLHLKSTLVNHLLATPQVTITEYNQFGDFSEVSQQQLKMSNAENNPDFNIENSLSYLLGMPDDEVIAYLRKRFNIEVDDKQLKVQYRSSQSGLAGLIKNQPPGSTICIPIYAKSKGHIQSNDVVVKITKRQENVIFTNQKSNLYFPDQALPLTSTEIWSDDVWKLSVIDSRTQDKNPWTLTATATATESTNGSNSRDLSDYLWYVDNQHEKAVSLKSSVTILGSKMKSTVDVNNPKEYDREFNKQKGSGIFIKTDPQMATGHYEATITWTLTMEATS